jgi:hypothetical protein
MEFITISYISLSAICLILILIGLKIGLRRSQFSLKKQQQIFIGTIITLLIWLVSINLLACKGYLSDFSTLPPKITLLLIPPMLIWLIVTWKSITLKIVLNHVSPHWIIYLQSFRIFVELLLWKQFMIGVTPIQMTFEGRNFDILVGLTAPIIGFLYVKDKVRFRKLALIWNFAGMALLINILVIAVLSFPTKFRYFMNEPSNTFVTEFPGILLPGLLVMIAYTMHYFSIKQLMITK